ncbi:hypothetical protein DFH11DRAFT_490007 [Phellopilus nigrolimitatus]|nr:hypothetical protein DFH11DRAFT_490007 [Phellopilus nigrolimitatus]
MSLLAILANDSPERRKISEVVSAEYQVAARRIHRRDTDRNLIPKRQTPPFLLTRVCRYWRQVTLTTPQLWTGLQLRFPREMDGSTCPLYHLGCLRVQCTHTSTSTGLVLSLYFALPMLCIRIRSNNNMKQESHSLPRS